MAELTEMEKLKVELARNYIAHIEAVKEDVATLQESIEMAYAAAGISGIDYSKVNVTTSPSDDQIPNAVLKIIEAKQAEAESLAFEQAEIDAFESRIAVLKTRGGLILQCLYAFNMTDIQIYRQYKPMPKTSYFRLKDKGLLELYNNGLPEAFKLPDEKAV